MVLKFHKILLLLAGNAAKRLFLERWFLMYLSLFSRDHF
ncbi:hypothetical protein NC652_034005 [Populus alba x Populus x berolinensis]|uniref:Uncharacterized protein n=1 Tax=Populus alba x Populus x berolinensis TaxID=444605 RepID=A0AAD6LUV6_9ROSI|nr:hypothetical protein NC652_034005 [Populus alba x Populus x berolinensis]KAJ6973714.1 hypothetical protein NC653_033911 [Populus alba x Populus x berolinensis]